MGNAGVVGTTDDDASEKRAPSDVGGLVGNASVEEPVSIEGGSPA